MLLTIHNLPSNTRYSDIKSMIQTRCGLSEVLLDNLVNEGQYKKVTVGVVEEEDAAMVVRQINGLYIDGQQLYVENMRQKKASEQPYRRESPANSKNKKTQQHALSNMPMAMNAAYAYPYNQQSMVPDPMMQMMMAQQMMGMGMYYMPQQQNSFMDNMGRAQYNTQDEYGGPSTHNSNRSNSFGQHYNERDQPFQGSDMYGRDYISHQDDYRQPDSNREMPRDKRVERKSRWQSHQESGPSQRRSVSPHNVESRKGPSYDDRYGFDDNYRQRNTSDMFKPAPQRHAGSTQRNKGGDRYERAQDRDSTQSKDNRNSSNLPAYLQPEKGGYDRDYVPPQQQPKKHSRYNLRNEGYVPPQQNRLQSVLDYYEPQSSSKPHQQASRDSYSSHQNQPSDSRKRPHPDQSGGKSQQRNEPPASFDNKSNNRWNTNANTQNVPPRNEYKKQKIDPPRSDVSPKGNAPKGITSLMDVVVPKVNLPAPKFNAPSRENAPVKSYQTKPPNNKPRDRPSRQKANKIRKDYTWRFQAAAQIGNVIYNKHNHASFDKAKNKALFKAIKASVHTRIELLMMNKLAVPVPAIIETYRNRFPTTEDKAFLAAVIENLDSEPSAQGGNTSNTNEGDEGKAMQVKTAVSQDTIKNDMPVLKKEGMKDQPTPKEIKVAQQPAKAVAPQKIHQSYNQLALAPSGKLPNYPQGDKAKFKTQKQIQKMEFENEDMYVCDPLIASALDKELDVMCNMFKEAMAPMNSDETIISQRLGVNSLIMFRKSIKLATIKRILDIRTNLAVRVFINGKIPPPSSISYYLRQRYGVISLKKSDKLENNRPFFIATCEDYAGYDEMFSLGAAEFDENTTFVFKPLNIAPTRPKLSKKDYKSFKDKLNNPNTQDFTEDLTFDDDGEGFSEDVKNEQLLFVDIPIPNIKPKQDVEHAVEGYEKEETKESLMMGGEEYKVQDEVKDSDLVDH